MSETIPAVCKNLPPKHDGMFVASKYRGACEQQAVIIGYTNYRGEHSVRTVIPFSIRFEETPHHKPAQWIMRAWDCDKGAERSFAMKDIDSWRVP